MTGICLIIVYFLPTIIAIATKHRQVAAICFLNVILGWTGIVWVGVMVWALINGKDDE